MNGGRRFLDVAQVAEGVVFLTRKARCVRLSQRFPENGVHERRRPGSAEGVREPHRLVHGRTLRHPARETKLVDSDAKRGERYGVDFLERSLAVRGENEVQLVAPAEDALGDIGH